MIRKAFAVKSNSFRTYSRFKRHIEDLGYKHSDNFTDFTEQVMRNCNCMYMSNDFMPKGELKFAFSNTYSGETRSYNIDDTMQFLLAVDYAKSIMRDGTKVTVETAEDKALKGPVRISFAIKSKHFETYEEFSKDLLSIGYKSNDSFNNFTSEVSRSRNGVYIGNNWQGKPTDPMYAFSNVSVGEYGADIIFDIDNPYEYFKAIMYARDKFKLYSDYNDGPKDCEEGNVKVSMQEIADWLKCDVKKLLITH